MKYCKTCLYPDTKPDLIFDDEGVCSACRSYRDRSKTDWEARAREFNQVADRYRSKDGSNYDCLIGVSGGKDSTYQVIRCMQAGLNPLCVTATTCALSDIGRRNIENLKRLGVDYIEVTTNPQVRKKLNKFALSEVGDISWPEHVSIFTVPVRTAVQFGIPLIVWGENPQNEYGGPASTGNAKILDRRWLEEFGGLIGLRVSDLVGVDGLSARDLIQFAYPSDDDLRRVGVTGVFLGYYFPWDGFSNALYAQAFGFETFPSNVEGSLTNYENLDNYQAGIHDYFKYLKFGFGRATDLANNHLRRGRISRKDAVVMVNRWDGKFPWSYLGRRLEDILADIDMTVDEFVAICDRFTNKKLFRCNNRGELIKDARGNLVKVVPLE
jgi:N-acetyl sugar amidotransferase